MRGKATKRISSRQAISRLNLFVPSFRVDQVNQVTGRKCSGIHVGPPRQLRFDANHIVVTRGSDYSSFDAPRSSLYEIQENLPSCALRVMV